MTKKKAKIKCDVESCVHQDSEEKVCELDEIKVSSADDCSDDEVVENSQTVCESFDCDKEDCNCDDENEEEQKEED